MSKYATPLAESRQKSDQAKQEADQAKIERQPDGRRPSPAPEIGRKDDTGEDEEKQDDDRDEVLRESFPASDPAPVSPGSSH